MLLINIQKVSIVLLNRRGQICTLTAKVIFLNQVGTRNHMKAKPYHHKLIYKNKFKVFNRKIRRMNLLFRVGHQQLLKNMKNISMNLQQWKTLIPIIKTTRVQDVFNLQMVMYMRASLLKVNSMVKVNLQVMVELLSIKVTFKTDLNMEKDINMTQ